MAIKPTSTQFITNKGSEKEVAFVKRLDQIIIHQKSALETKWYQLSSMLAGKHYLSWENNYQRLVEDDAPSYRIRYMNNRMLTILNRETARITSGIPIVDIMPASDSREDKAIAKINDAVNRFNWQPGVQDMEKKTRSVVNWALRTGLGLFKVEWDKHEGAPIYKNKTEERYNQEIAQDDAGKPILDSFGDPIYEPVAEKDSEGVPIQYPVLDKDGQPILDKVVYLGDLKVSVIPPTDFFVLRRYENLQDSPICVNYYLSRIEDVRSRWDAAKSIDPQKFIPPVKRTSELIRNVYFDFTIDGFSHRFMGSGDAYKEDIAFDENNEGLVLVWEIWRKPTRKLPGGELLIVCEDKVLHKGKNPYNHKKYPFVDFKEIPWEGQYWPMSTQEFLVGTQKSYNRSRSQEMEDANLTSNPVLITYPASKANVDHLVNRPGAEIKVFMKGYEPKYLQRNPSNIAQYKNIQMAALQDLDEVAGQHEVSRGEAPGRLDSSLALSWLSQKDEQGVMPKISNLNRCRENTISMMLSVQAQFVTEERILRIVGQSLEIESSKFVGQEMAGSDPRKSYFEVRIRPSSTKPANKAAQKNEMLSLLERGVYHPQTDRRRILLAFEEGDVQEAYQEDRLDRARAKKEIELMREGQEVQIRQYENHQLHNEEHILYMKTDEFYNADQQQQKFHFQHYMQHEQVLQKRLEQQMMMQMMMAGKGAGSPAGNGGQKKSSGVSDSPQNNQKKSTLNALYGAGG